MSDLKTLKDISVFLKSMYDERDVDEWNFHIKAGAVKVFQAHRNEDLEDATLFWRFLTFFNLTEEDLE